MKIYTIVFFLAKMRCHLQPKRDVKRKIDSTLYKFTKETLTSTSCGNAEQQRRGVGERERVIVKRDLKKHFTVFILLPFRMQWVGL